MACYYPLIRIEDLTKYIKAVDGHLYHPAKIIKQDEQNDIETLKKYSDSMHYKSTIIPCTKCIGCRLDYAKDWANRTYLESQLYDHNYFVTLTYQEEFLPYNEELTDKNGITWVDEGKFLPSLKAEHLTTFIKELRTYFKRKYDWDGIRFIACGEYGEEKQRPHYHLILLNCPFPTETFYNPRISNKNVYYQNTILEQIWKKGISNICPANWNTMSYTARYITKKVNGTAETDIYYANGIIKEFFRMSRDPGIGKPYYDLHKEEIYKDDRILIKNRHGVHYEKPPKYFDDLYKEEYPERWKDIQWKREREGRQNTAAKIAETSLFMREQLQIEARSKEEQTLKLVRAMEKPQ